MTGDDCKLSDDFNIEEEFNLAKNNLLFLIDHDLSNRDNAQTKLSSKLEKLEKKQQN